MTTAATAAACREESASLACQMNGSDKVYHIQLTQSEAGWTVNAQYGPRNGTLTPQSKLSDAPYEKAKKEFDKLVAANLKGKGDGTHYSHTTPASSQPLAPRTNSRGPVSTDVVFSCELLTRCTEREAIQYAANPRYIFQTKQDGDRLTVCVDGENIFGYNKLGQVVRLDAKLHAAILRLCQLSGIKRLLIDGEWEPTGYYAWDILEYWPADAPSLADLRHYPYADRVTVLDLLFGALIPAASFPEMAAILHITNTAWTPETKLAMLGNKQLEGVAIKDCNAPFRPGRNGQHLKFKFEQTASFAVGPKPKEDGKRSVALYLFDPAWRWHSDWQPEGQTAFRFVCTVKIADKYDVPPISSRIEARYLYAYKNTGGIAQPCYFGKVRSDVRLEDCSTAQLKWKAEAEEI